MRHFFFFAGAATFPVSHRARHTACPTTTGGQSSCRFFTSPLTAVMLLPRVLVIFTVDISSRVTQETNYSATIPAEEVIRSLLLASKVNDQQKRPLVSSLSSLLSDSHAHQKTFLPSPLPLFPPLMINHRIFWPDVYWPDEGLLCKPSLA